MYNFVYIVTYDLYTIYCIQSIYPIYSLRFVCVCVLKVYVFHIEYFYKI